MQKKIFLSIKYGFYRSCLKHTLEAKDDILIAGDADFLCEEDYEICRACDVIITDSFIKENIALDCDDIYIVALTSQKNYDVLKISGQKFNAVLSLNSSFEKLIEVIQIHSASKNKIYVDDDLNNTCKKSANNSKNNLLTYREKEVLEYIAQGCFNKEIASKMGITERTVKNYVSNIFKKIDVCDRTQAALYAIKNNMVDL